MANLLNLTTFLDTDIRHRYETETKVYNKSKKLPVHWSSKIPIRYQNW